MISNNKPFIAKISAEVKLVALYTCSDCGTSVHGTTVRESVGVATSLWELDESICKISLRTAHPVGWASYPDDVYRCQEHKI